MQGYGQNIMGIFAPDCELSLQLLNSEDFFWIATAAALGFAAEELSAFSAKNPQFVKVPVHFAGSNEALDRLKLAIKQGSISAKERTSAQADAFSNLELLSVFAETESESFSSAVGLALGKTFATYWLIFKLIELEWQEMLKFDRIKETYLLLDTIIMDLQDLERIEEKLFDGLELSEDSVLYLESHWERVGLFWKKLARDLDLLARGLYDYKGPY